MFVIADFQLESPHPVDYVEITDGDGTNIVPAPEGRECGVWGGPEKIVSATNRVLVNFHTDGNQQRRGWRLEWTERKLDN